MTEVSIPGRKAKFFMPAIPCKHGHLSPRYATNGTCLECRTITQAKFAESHPDVKKQYYRANKQKMDARKKVWKLNHRDHVNAQTCGYYRANPKAHHERVAVWVKENPDKAKATRDCWRAENKARLNAQQANRRSVKLLATPKWANQAYLQLFYVMAKEETTRLSRPVEVDHIVPLRHPLVCGLHCENNLQLMFESDNKRKSNKHWPDMPGSDR